MIDTKYGLKYSFPHTLVHIVDNSAYAGETPVITSYDPSLFATIVVTGMPMGIDRQIVTITRSDVLNKAFGAESLTNSDINKYGQSVEYPASLIRQGAPVRLLRVTPDDAAYGVVVLYVEWQKIGNDIEVRLNKAPLADLIAEGIDLAAYANTDRVAKATFSKLASKSVDGGWRREVLMTYVSAGRGSAYNNFSIYINSPSFEQMKKYDNAVYNFGTIDNRTSSTISNEIEQFTASLINDATKLSAYGVTTSIDSVNVQMKKRLEGSSIMIPYVNEQTIRIIYAEWLKLYDDNLANNVTTDASVRRAYEEIHKAFTVNKFDCIYGKTIYNDDIVNIPYLVIDTLDTDIPQLDASHIVVTGNHEGSNNVDEHKNLNAIYGGKINPYYANMYNVDVNTSYSSSAVNPGTVFLVNQDTAPVFNVVHIINPYTGAIGSVRIPNAKNLLADNTVARITRNNKVQDPDTSEWIADENNPTTIVYDSAPIAKYFYYTKRVSKPVTSDVIKLINSQIDPATCGFTSTAANPVTSYDYHEGEVDPGSRNVYGSIIAVGYVNNYGIKTFALYQINQFDTTTGVQSLLEYPVNIYASLNFLSYAGAEKIYDIIALKSYAADVAGKTITISDEDIGYVASDIINDIPDKAAFMKTGALYIDDVTTTLDSGDTLPNFCAQKVNIIENIWNEEVSSEVTYKMFVVNVGGINCARVGTVPQSINIYQDLLSETYDVINYTTAHKDEYQDDIISKLPADDTNIWRYTITGTALSSFRVANTNIAVPKNYYLGNYGISTSSVNGGVAVEGGSSGFFDDENMSSLEFKLRYSELLVKAFRGEIDPRILSPTRVPAKFMFDGGFNTVLSIRQLPFTEPDIDDVIYASTIFTNEEKEEFAFNKALISGKMSYSDIDVKKAMYDLMIERVYQRIPEDKRPIGPGSGLQLYLDSGLADIETIKAMNTSFKSRFTNPNASWDIGGYTSSVNGVTYTYVKYIVDHLFDHCNMYNINKPYANTYATIANNEYTDFFPNVDATDWDLEELLYQSGGNSWVLDQNGGLRRKSQRTLYREATGTSDLLQESNMRTLSQLVFLLQNQLDNWLFEYIDDGALASMRESVNNIFSGWVGTRVQALDIDFERDLNTDGGEIVVCYVNVTFRGILLRIPIIVNVNRRQS